jgi:WD40 repeat protein
MSSCFSPSQRRPFRLQGAAAHDQSLRTFTGHTSLVNSVAFSRDGARALSGSYDETLKLWDVASGRELRTFSGHTGGVYSVAFSPDGARTLSGSGDSTLKLWDLSPYLAAR